MPLEGGMWYGRHSAVYIIRGDAKFEFELPAEGRDISIDNLKLSIISDSGFFNAPEISILNPETATGSSWMAQPRSQPDPRCSKVCRSKRIGQYIAKRRKRFELFLFEAWVEGYR